MNEGQGLLKLADTLLVLINPSPNNANTIYVYVQGISFRNGLYELDLRDKDIQLRFGLKMVLEC